jgi:phospholipid/cholesterol/gamma-HCH transport system ATP-binding protein
MASVQIEIQNVSLSFGNNLVLQSINLQIEKGQSLAIVGPSGVGKSSLLKVMAGIQKPSVGQVLIEGESLYDLEPKEQLKKIKKMGMLFQKNALFDSMTSLENVLFPMQQVTDMTDVDMMNRALYFLENVGLSEALNKMPDAISGGMQKRLGIARVMALKPEIAYFDDPTAGLDPITGRKIIDLILNVRKETKSTIITVTNDMRRAYQIADQIAFLFSGELLVTGTTQETKKYPDPRVQQFINGQVQGPLSEFA